MNQPIIIIGIGELAGVFARGFLRNGYPVFPITRDMDMSKAFQKIPDPALVLVAVSTRLLAPLARAIDSQRLPGATGKLRPESAGLRRRQLRRVPTPHAKDPGRKEARAGRQAAQRRRPCGEVLGASAERNQHLYERQRVLENTTRSWQGAEPVLLRVRVSH